MGLKELYPLVLLVLLVAMLLGAGILALSKFEVAVKDTTAFLNESVTFTAGVGTTTNDEVASIQAIRNQSGYAYVVIKEYNLTSLSDGVIHMNSTVTAEALYVDYTFDADNKVTSVLSSATTEAGNISTNWLGLIITIAILSIIITLVVKSFGVKR